MPSKYTQVVMRGRGNPSSSLDTSPTVPHPIALLVLYAVILWSRIRPLDRDLDPSIRFTRNGPIRTPYWVAVSQVCHRWHQVALRCKALWTCIPLVSVPGAQHALTLSNPQPITLRIDSRLS
jgi:hypothetical protein